jgi:predicted nucleic acid-binding protein
MRLIFLDSGILGMVSNPRGTNSNLACQLWLENLLINGENIVIPEIADYEVRRELIRAKKKAGLKRLDQLKSVLAYLPITTETMLLAAQFWAEIRQTGKPNAAPNSLDGDVILAAIAKLEEIKGFEVIVATTNVKYLSLFIDARDWSMIT